MGSIDLHRKQAAASNAANMTINRSVYLTGLSKVGRGRINFVLFIG